jgi:hypothetical protein
LSFKASADVDRKIEVNFQQSVDPWGAYATKEFDITTTEKEYTFIFAMEEDSDDAAQFAINLGQATGTVKISDVKLVFTTAEPGSEGGDGPVAIARPVSLNKVTGTAQVFDIAGKFMGKVEMIPGTTLSDAIASKFQKSGVYMVKTAAGIQKVRVTAR